jgi:signal transduction histidine kinase
METKVALDNDMVRNDDMTALPGFETSQKPAEADYVLDDSQELLLKAQKDAELAKVVARQAISRAFQQSEATLKRAEVLARAFDDALQGSFSQMHRDEKDSAGSSGNGFDLSGYVKKLLNNGQHPLSAISDMAKSLSVNTAVDAETRMDFYNQVIRQSKQLRELIDDLVARQVQKKIDKAVEEARSDRIASKLAVQQAQSEVDKAREEAARAQSEAETARRDAEEAINIARGWVEEAKREFAAERKTAGVKANQAEQLALSRTAAEVRQARDEVAAAEEAARNAIKHAEAEARRSRQEIDEIRDQARLDVALAREKAEQEAEKVEAVKQQAQVAIDKALAEAVAAREEAEKIRRDCEQAVYLARAESRRAIEKVEKEKKRIQEAVIESQQQSYRDVCEEMNKVKAEAEATRKTAYETIKRAQEESRRAKEEATAVKKDAETTLARAAEETRRAKEEADSARQALQEVIARAQEENRLIKQEAEASILMASETMKNARKDIIGMTIGEITRTRQELEAVSRDPGVIRDILHPMEKPLASAAEQTGQSTPGTEFFNIDEKALSPHKLITEAVQGAREIISQKKNVIILSLPGTLPAIEADGIRIKQVLLNLITNAIKFSPENSAIIVRAEVRESEFLIRVKDRGIGIPQEELESIFEEGYRAANCGEAVGLGLGLHICRQIVAAHGGRIWAESLAGQGSTFSLALPLAPVNS